MRKKNYYINSFTALVMSALVFSSCEKFLDVNKNLNSPTAVPVSLILSNAEIGLANSVALGTGLGGVTSVYTHQTIGRVGADRYGAGAAGWGGLYSSIKDFDVIIKQGTAEKRFVYVGVAKILKAYAFSVLVDVYGDCPFSEFNKFDQGITQPKFDKGADIYPQLIKLIDEGVADFSNTAPNPSKPGNDDYIYKGNTTNWIKAANTLKLKLYTQVRLVQDVKTQVAALLASPSTLINSQAESFMLPYGPFGTTDDRHPAYGDYNATQRGGQLFSPWLYEIMKGKNTGIFTGITDPRIPYYIYNQKSATGSTATPENCTDYRDGGFITITFGSTGPCRDGSNSSTYSLLGLYPAGGRYEDGLARTITTIGALNAGTGALPHQFITYADRLYLQAELINAGVATGTEKTVFSQALDASFLQMDYIITNFIKPGSSGAPQVVPAIATLAATTTYKTAVLAAYDKAATASKRLEFIMTEKWINRIENPVDNWTDYRRTKFPVLFSPAPIGTVTTFASPGAPPTYPPTNVPVSNDRAYPLSLPFDVNEISLNSNALPQKVAEAYRVFWQPVGQ